MKILLVSDSHGYDDELKKGFRKCKMWSKNTLWR